MKRMTALQKLISDWESMKSFHLPNEPIFDEFIKDAKKMLEMEKQQIIQAHEDAYLDCGFEYSASDCANNYYKERYDKI